MFVNYFIKRPIFTTAISIVIVFLGVIAGFTLPIAQFPEIAPVQVVVTSNYTGADAETVENAVTNILEREINGVKGMKYISSNSVSDGTSEVTVTFEGGQDPDIATVNVQNRVSRVQPLLPSAVTQTGVVVNQQSSNFLMAIALYSDDNKYDSLFMSNYADVYLLDGLRRITGVGSIQIFGERKYAMRLWLDPPKLASRGLTAEDVADAIREQNIQVGAGQIGQQPAPENQQYQFNLQAVSRMTSVAEFEDLVVKTGKEGSLVRLKDVGRVELGAQNYGTDLTFNGKPAIGMGVSQRPNTNALNTAQAIRDELKRLEADFPPGLNYAIAFDTTMFVSESFRDVVNTLLESVFLVVLVIFIFLQDWRATLIPSITIVVSLLGTFIFTKIFGFSLNTLTLFGLTLATGIVVDDAIVVVEAVTVKIQDKGMEPYPAAVEAMRDLTGALIATSLVLMAVFVPVAFFPGTTGAIYQQFALTIAFSIAISTVNALTLTPALSALLLRPRPDHPGLLSGFFNGFNRLQDSGRRRYRRSLGFLNRFRGLIIGLFAASLVLTVWVYQMVPSAFLPDEDQGYFITIVQAPEGVSLNYTKKILDQASAQVMKMPDVQSNFAITGFSFAGVAPNQGIMFTLLKPWEERTRADQKVDALIGAAQKNYFGLPDANIFALNPPAIQGLGNFGGFQLELQDRRGNLPLNEFVANFGAFLGVANKSPTVKGVFSTYSANTPQFRISVDREKAKAMNVKIDDLFSTLQTFLGSQYVNDFTLDRRNYRVYIQADQQFRSQPSDIESLYVRSEDDQMVQLSGLVKVEPTTSAQTITHYNLYRSISVQGATAPGQSSGQAIKAMEQAAAQVLPVGMGLEWTGTALEEITSGNQAPLIFGLGLVLVFLALAAQYESYVDPLIIMLTVPLAIFGALMAVHLRGIPNDVYCQIALVMLIGLASKNAILIVEYANQLREDGLTIPQAAIEAAQERIRPILMTAIASLVGFFPLVLASGAGAASRQSLGTALLGGYLIATFLSLFLVPILYIVIKQSTDRFLPHKPEKLPQPSLPPSEVSSR